MGFLKGDQKLCQPFAGNASVQIVVSFSGARAASRSGGPKMNIWTELFIGVLIGLTWSLKSLMAALPCNMVPFFCNSMALYYMLGGVAYGKLKLLAGVVTFMVFRMGDQVVDLMWHPFSCLANNLTCFAVNRLVALAQTSLQGMLGQGRRNTFW